MIEWVVIFSVILCIVVWYYSQSNTEYSFSHIKAKQIPLQLTELWGERKPVVVSEVRPNTIWVAEGLRVTRFWGAQPVWGEYQSNPAGAVVLANHALQRTWADILGITTLDKEQYLNWFDISPYLYSTRTEAHIGAEGLRQTYGWATAVSVTEGEGRAILLHSAQKPKLPPGWNGLRWKDATVAHHPLWTQVQCIEILLRPGTTLLVPPHWILAVEPVDVAQPLWWTRTDIHNPISSWAQWLNEKS